MGNNMHKNIQALPSSRKVMETGSALSICFLLSTENHAAKSAEIIPKTKPRIMLDEIFWVTKYIPGITNKLSKISMPKILFLK